MNLVIPKSIMLNEFIHYNEAFFFSFFCPKGSNYSEVEKIKDNTKLVIEDYFSINKRNINLSEYHNQVNRLYITGICLQYYEVIKKNNTIDHMIKGITDHHQNIKDTEDDLKKLIFNLTNTNLYMMSDSFNIIARTYISYLLAFYYYNHYCDLLSPLSSYTIIHILYPAKTVPKGLKITKDWFRSPNLGI